MDSMSIVLIRTVWTLTVMGLNHLANLQIQLQIRS